MPQTILRSTTHDDGEALCTLLGIDTGDETTAEQIVCAARTTAALLRIYAKAIREGQAWTPLLASSSSSPA